MIHEDWQKNPAKINAIGDQVETALGGVRDTGGKPASVLKIVPGDWLAKARDQVLAQRDKAYGGLDGGGGTKFPQAPVITLLLTDYRLNGTGGSLQAAREMLNAMAYGGIHDQVGGGMHRYSTEPTWSVPHFEKMLYDNAQLIGLYADDYAAYNEFFWTRGPAFPLYHATSSDLRRLHRRLPRFFTLKDGVVTATWPEPPTPQQVTGALE